ncbi:putative splicing factor, RBM39, nucleotide-binding alpha-beta plait domain superfamily [Arabidopsis thaliana]|uniref:RNA recognition motif domain n=2 Tax=Arabidopsis TaxID=3701 RepID=A0A8T2DB57_ARASU|nr:RNA recognition motif domain [Arabidopsis thaliana x Arabidopsis arenosa]KAG7608699.1 RNA recognition motif domain [Arabidopsis suecica]
MEFDEYEYLEKTVEEGAGSNKKKEESGNERSERSYRKREGGERQGEEGGEEERVSSRSKKSRGDGEENGGGKRDRERERHRSSRDKDRERDKVREGSRDKESDRERSSKERDRSDRDKPRDRERREREKRSSSRSRREEKEPEVVDRGSRRHRDKKDEPEADPERDQRTVFAYQMPLKATERDVYEFFSKAGKVRDVRLIMDRNSRRSKGVGYIEFYDVMSVPMAIALSGQLFLGQPVMVKPSEAEKNLAQSNSTTVGGTGPADRKLYVGNLHFNMSELQLRQIFEAFGPVELVQLPLDPETGQCKGFGFIQFVQLEHSKAAQIALNGKLEIAGRTIKVSSVSDHIGTQDSAPKSADFDDDDGGGLALNAQSRAMLMQKLDRSGIATSIVGSLGVPGLNGAAFNQPGMNPSFPTSVLPTTAIPSFVNEHVGLPSECLLLKNMFDPATETEPNFDLEIRDDVADECSKYGPVNHIYVDKNSAGFVYLRFQSVEAAAAAQRAMHMRWFAQKMISATFMPPHEYEAKAKA